MSEQVEMMLCTEGLYQQAVAVLNDGFLPKFRRMHPDEQIRRSFVDDFGLIALGESSSDYIATDGQRVLGVLLLKEAGGPKHLPNRSTGELVRRYGISGVIKAMILGLLVAHTPDQDELYIDSIAVSDDARGMGVGTTMLDFAQELAVKHGCRRLTLQVMIENPRAQRLYERFGFTVTHTVRSLWLRWLTGYSGAHYMEQQLPSDALR